MCTTPKFVIGKTYKKRSGLDPAKLVYISKIGQLVLELDCGLILVRHATGLAEDGRNSEDYIVEPTITYGYQNIYRYSKPSGIHDSESNARDGSEDFDDYICTLVFTYYNGKIMPKTVVVKHFR